MEHQDSLLTGWVTLDDWEHTPECVRSFVDSLLTQNELLKSDKNLIQFLDSMPIGLAIYDVRKQLIYTNPLGRSLLGGDYTLRLDHLQRSKMPLSDQSSPHRFCPIAELSVLRALSGENTAADHLELHYPDRIVSLEVSASPVFNDQGQVIYAIVTFKDISDRQRIETAKKINEEALRQSESRYRHIIQTQTDFILHSLPDTTITFANQALCKALGCSLEKVIQQKWIDFADPNDLQTIFQNILKLSPDHPQFTAENRDRRADDQVGWTQWINRGIFNDQGKLIEIQSVGRDITPLRQVELALRESEERQRTILQLNSVGTWDWNLQNHQVIWSDQIFKLVDIESTITPSYQAFQNVVHPEDIKPLKKWLLRLAKSDQNHQHEFRVILQNGMIRWLQAKAKSVSVRHNQESIHLLGILLDISDRQHSENERFQVLEALRQSELRFRNMAANVPGAIFRYLLRPDGSDSVLYMSPGCYRLWEIEASLVEQNAALLWEMIYPDDQAGMYASVMESARTLQPWSYSWRIVTPSGRKKWLEASGRPEQQPNGDIIWDTLILDISDRKESEIKLRRSEERYRLLAENMNDLVCLHRLDGRYLFVSPSCQPLLGFQPDEMCDQKPTVFFHPEERDRIDREIRAAIVNHQPSPIVHRMRQKSGNYIWFETLAKAILDDYGQPIQLQTNSRDITERIQVQNQLQHEALHDSLTGLANRNLLMERLELAINRAKRFENYQFAILFLDLDRFKVINDSLGHLVGDQLLVTVAQTLQNSLRSTDLAVRLGGDEFVILLDGVKDIKEVVKATERIFSELRVPWMIDGREVYTTASIGIVLGNSYYNQAAHLLRDADIAMYQAKQRGKSRYEIFNAEMHDQALRRLNLENDLRQALERQEFVLYYQPIVCLDNGRLVGFETLVRWQHPTQGLKAPGEFISVAEETGMITVLDYWVLRSACRQLAIWQSIFPELETLWIHINLSAQDLRRQDLYYEIDRTLLQTNLAGECLTLEITESMLIEDIESTIALLNRLKQRGVQISIDDFGTGYSSLNYLHRLPVDSLKVDRSFVSQIQDDSSNLQIIETIVALSKSLNIDAVAEGIETPKQWQRLKALGYRFGQGYLFSKPLSQADTEALLASGSYFYRQQQQC